LIRSLNRVTAPILRPVTLAEVKQAAKIEHDEDDLHITGLIDSVTDYIDGPGEVLGRALCDQVWDLYLDAFPVGAIEIPLPPLISIDEFEYIDAAGATQSVLASNYRIIRSARGPTNLVLAASSWPSAKLAEGAVRIRFSCGYGDDGGSPPTPLVPGAIRGAIMAMVIELNRKRETSVIGASVSKLPWSAEQLLKRHKVDLGMA
jgi:uncharacterized phiE125 gp8 family phage protein